MKKKFLALFIATIFALPFTFTAANASRKMQPEVGQQHNVRHENNKHFSSRHSSSRKKHKTIVNSNKKYSSICVVYTSRKNETAQ